MFGDIFTGGLHLLLIDLPILQAGHVLYVESLEEADEVQVL